MSARFPVMAFRLLVLVAVWLLGTSTLSLAGEGGSEEPAQETPQVETNAEPTGGNLVVPDVRGLPYVFAKGVLEDSGFAWRVEGGVEGYAVNVVSEQSVKPGTKVIDTGTPTIVLHLGRQDTYDEVGLPEDSSPYPGTKVLLANGEKPEAAGVELEGSAKADAADEAAPTDESATDSTSTEGTATGPEQDAITDPATTDVEPAAQATGGGKSDSSDGTATRPPAFHVAGAPVEPLDEIPLPARAQQLLDWLAKQSAWTSGAADHYNYQHAWVVTGARFGWWHGTDALRTLLEADQQLQQRFGVGASFQRIAKAALAEVLQKTAAA